MPLYTKRKLLLLFLIAWKMLKKRCRCVCQSQNVCPTSIVLLLLLHCAQGINLVSRLLARAPHVSHHFTVFEASDGHCIYCVPLHIQYHFKVPMTQLIFKMSSWHSKLYFLGTLTIRFPMKSLWSPLHLFWPPLNFLRWLP